MSLRFTARLRRQFTVRTFGWALLLAVTGLLLVWPLIMLTVGAFRTTSPLQGGGKWSIAAFGRMWTELNTNNALLNSVLFSLSTTVFGVGIATLLAFLSQRTDSPLRRWITPTVVVAVSTSALFYAIAYGLLGNEFTGAVNVLYRALVDSDGSIVDVETFAGLIFVDSIHAAAFVYLFLAGPFGALDRSHEEAALVAGASRWKVLTSVNVPMLTPIFVSVLLIGLISGLQSFTTPLILGSEANLSFLSVRIFHVLQRSSPPAYSDASALALILVALILVLAGWQAWILRDRNFTSVTGKSYRQYRWELGRWRYLSGAFIAAYVFFAVIAPLSVVVLASFQPFPGVYSRLGTRNYEALVKNPALGDLFLTTAVVSAVGAALGTVLAFVIAYASQRASPIRRMLLRVTTIVPMAMPGVIGAVAVIWAFTSIPGIRKLYGTSVLLVIGLVIAVVTVLVQIASGAVTQISRDLEDAARTSGASAVRAVLGITVRLLVPHFVAGWFLAAVLIMGNLEVPLLLSSAGTRTVSVQTYGLVTAGQHAQAAALLTLLVAAVAIAGLLAVAVRAWAGRRRIDAARTEPHEATETTPVDLVRTQILETTGDIR